MHTISALSCVLLFIYVSTSNAQRITTIQLDGVQYFVSRMNPYSPELNYFLAYQYCRSLGLQLASFETREKADSITQYLSNAGYNKYDFWTSGNKLGTDMFLWMSTGLPFNATFNYMKKPTDSAEENTMDIPSGSTSPQRTARESDSGASNGCVTLKQPSFEWDTDDCMAVKDFICEQTRCYYYNYGSIPVSSAQGKVSYTTTTTTVRSLTSSEEPAPAPQPLVENKYVHFGMNEFINKLRTTSVNSKDHAKSDDAGSSNPTSSNLFHGNSDDKEQSTNGPYDSFHSVEMQDDPVALVDNSQAPDELVSTMEPETVTIYERSFKTVL